VAKNPSSAYFCCPEHFACSSKINKSMMLAFPLNISQQLKQAIAILMSWVAILLIILVLTSNMWANFCLFQQR
jgi:hypothetical protein